MPPNTHDPYLLLAWFLGVFIGLPGFVLLVKAIFFVGGAHRDLKTVVAYVKERSTIDQELHLTLAFVENDINVLQDNAGLARREWPERRLGPADRRHSA